MSQTPGKQHIHNNIIAIYFIVGKYFYLLSTQAFILFWFISMTRWRCAYLQIKYLCNIHCIKRYCNLSVCVYIYYIYVCVCVCVYVYFKILLFKAWLVYACTVQLNLNLTMCAHIFYKSKSIKCFMCFLCCM